MENRKTGIRNLLIPELKSTSFPACTICGEEAEIYTKNLTPDNPNYHARCSKHLSSKDKILFDISQRYIKTRKTEHPEVGHLTIDPQCFICVKPAVGIVLFVSSEGLSANNPRWISYCSKHGKYAKAECEQAKQDMIAEAQKNIEEIRLIEKQLTELHRQHKQR